MGYLTCSFCNRCFTHKQHLEKHTKSKRCYSCKLQFHCLNALKVHQQEHNCVVCNTTFRAEQRKKMVGTKEINFLTFCHSHMVHMSTAIGQCKLSVKLSIKLSSKKKIENALPTILNYRSLQSDAKQRERERMKQQVAKEHSKNVLVE